MNPDCTTTAARILLDRMQRHPPEAGWPIITNHATAWSAYLSQAIHAALKGWLVDMLLSPEERASAIERAGEVVERQYRKAMQP